MTDFSLDDLDANKACEVPYELEYVTPNGSSIFMSILGSESNTVSLAVSKLTVERRKIQANLEVKFKNDKEALDLAVYEANQLFSYRLIACRLIGWKNISAEFNEVNALRLVKNNSDISTLIVSASNNIANFMKI